jgi:hypothetical protein
VTLSPLRLTLRNFGTSRALNFRRASGWPAPAAHGRDRGRSRLFARVDKGKAPLLGTCFAFRHPRFFLTAAHCLGRLKPEDIIIAPADRTKIAGARQVQFHPSADLAILEIDRDAMDDQPNYFRTAPKPQMGMNFLAYGFPIIGSEDFRPRVFAGIFQTFHDHVSHMEMEGAPGIKYRYFAGELSIPCPHGLSGGPVFRPEAPDDVMALVTENLEVGTVEHSVETEEKSGERYSLETKRIILYGLAVVLAEVNEWLIQNIPALEM